MSTMFLVRLGKRNLATFFLQENAMQACNEYPGLAYEEFTPRCSWGSAYADTHCTSDATWFDRGFAAYGALCDEHHKESESLFGREGMLPFSNASRRDVRTMTALHEIMARSPEEAQP